MIGRIRGIIIAKQPPYLLVDVGGVGYEIAVPMTTFYHLPDKEQETILYTHLVIREDAHHLYGFYHERDRSLFRALIKVNGVGPKLALTILSGMEPNQFVQCVLQKNTNLLISIPGIGKKTAERLIMETKDALSSWQTHNISLNTFPDQTNQSMQDAISALIALGYKPKEASHTISQIQQPHYSSEEMIRLALKHNIEREQ